MQEAQTASLRLAEVTEARISGLWARHEAGGLTLEQFRSLVAALVAQANTAGVQLADIGVAAEVARQLRQIPSPLGLTPTAVQVDQRRITADIDRILADEPDVEDLSVSRDARLRRLGRSEPLLTVAVTVQTAMAARGARGWVRELDRDPCPVCRGWADGVVRSPGTRMARHLGCGCIQRPVFT